MRILSLLPAATDIVYLLGLEKYLIGTEKDFPSEITNKLSSKDINKMVSGLIHKGSSVFHIDQEKLKSLKPDLILTQELCQVCAISFSQVKKAARIFGDKTKTISLEPESIEDILENIKTVGEAVGGMIQDKEKILSRQRELLSSLRSRMTKISSRLRSNNKQSLRLRLKDNYSSTKQVKRAHGEVPKVLIIEWLEPLMVAGHWVPEMVERSGGEMLITKKGERSKVMIRSELAKLNPDLVIVAPCGFDIKRTLKEKHRIEALGYSSSERSESRSLIGNSSRLRSNSKVYLLDSYSPTRSILLILALFEA